MSSSATVSQSRADGWFKGLRGARSIGRLPRIDLQALLSGLRQRIGEHRPRNSIPPAVLHALVILGLLPLVLVSLRVLALPGGSSGLLALGDWLNRNLGLLWIPPADRDVVLYIVQLPLAALLVALTRLSLGIRVLGFRAILIAIGFQEIGILPSLLLIAVVALSVVVVRPWMRNAGMPLFARVATILCLVAATMVGGLLLGEALGSSILWSFAFFPVIILAMLAESIADTVARENTRMAAWRTGATIVLALIIAGLSQITLLRELMLACPELILTQLVLVALVAELLDWRLFEGIGKHETAAAIAPGVKLPPIAVVRNRWNAGVLRHSGTAAPADFRQRSVQPLVDALRARGHSVKVFEGDGRLLEQLRTLVPREQQSAAVPALVINCAGGVQGRGRLCQVPALCEMLGVPYTGPDPLAMATLADRALLLQTLAAHGLPTPELYTLDRLPGGAQAEGAQYTVRARFDAEYPPQRCSGEAALKRAMAKMQARFGEVLIECEGPGHALRVVVQQEASGEARALPALSWHSGSRRYRPAQLPDARTRDQISELAVRAFRALRLRDLARVDLRLRNDGSLCITAVRGVDLFSPRGAAASAAAAAGMRYDELLDQLMRSAIARQRPAPAADTSCTGAQAARADRFDPPSHTRAARRRPGSMQ